MLRLMRGLQHEMGMAVMFITHDMGVVAEIADRVVVMRAARRSRRATSCAIFERPAQPYTRALLAAVPTLGALAGTAAAARRSPIRRGSERAAAGHRARRTSAPVLAVRDLVTRFTSAAACSAAPIGGCTRSNM